MDEIARITEVRIDDPDFGFRHALRRKRREHLTTDGKLNVVAADHPARRVTAAGDTPLAMADRPDFLERILRVLSCDLVDGVMASMDVLEELLIVAGLRVAAGQPDPLAEKLLIASLNRGGLAGTVWELDDPVTGPSAEACFNWKLDGAKILLRICDNDPGSLRTLETAARVMRETARLRVPMFLEPLPMERTEGGFRVVRTPEALAKIVGVASALGDGSRRLWLKLPYCPGYEAVAKATTLPILVLGGESAGDVGPFVEELKAAMAAGANVRGAMVGRNVLYPGEGDSLEAAERVGRMIRGVG